VTATESSPPYTPPYLTQSGVGTPALVPPPSDETVTLTIDGREVTAPKGSLMITAAEAAGIYIPRFCYHPRMKPVGMCRMCLVEVAGPRGASLMPACYNTVAEGMDIKTNSPLAAKAQDGVLEMLLVNHPLDCPVCDKGGECPLQDQTLAYGPGETRFVEEKRHWDKPIPLSDLVYLDRERCIQCGRCVRFADEVAGDRLIDFASRGDTTEVATFPTEPYASYFSGNVVQICPVGALTAQPYRFKARPWDLDQSESTCTSCSVGCRVAVQSSGDELTRYLGVDSDPVNWGWLCDKGRFDFQSVESPQRLTVPLIRQGDELVEASWSDALAAAAEGLAAVRDVAGGEAVAVIGGARLPNEDAYAWAKLARVALHTDNVDAQLGDGLPARLVLGLPRATIDATVAAPLIITLSADIKEELPVLYLRLKDAADKGARIVELNSAPTGFTRYTSQSVRYRPGDLVALVQAIAGAGGEVPGVPAAEIEAVRAQVTEALAKGTSDAPSIVVVLGRPSLAEPEAQVAEAAAILAGLPGVSFLSALRRANVHGALDLGLAPGVLPGRVALEEGREWYEERWGTALPETPGLDTAGILAAAAEDRIGGLVLVGADPLADFPDADLAGRGVAGARFVVAVDTFLTDSARQADVVLPASSYAERRGTTTNLEGRISWLSQKVTAPGVAWPDWMIAAELALELGSEFGWEEPGEIWSEIEAVSPLHHGVTYELLTTGASRDGVIVPYDAAAPTAVPRRLDPMADPGIATAELNLGSFLTSAFGTALSQAAAEREVADMADPPWAGVEAQRAGATAAAPPGGAAPASIPAPGTLGVGSSGPDVMATSAVASRVGTPFPGSVASSPSMLRVSDFRAPARPATPGGSELRLVAVRTLWDAGTLVANSPSLAALAPIPSARIHPADAERLGLQAGDAVRVTSSRGEVILPVRLERGLALGSVVVPFNQPTVSAAWLIDATAAVTAVTVGRVTVTDLPEASPAGGDNEGNANG
jgi:NADH-quinone oxidoreductase subunit G